MPGAALALMLFFVIVAIAIRLIAGSSDRDRITAEINRRGGEVLDIAWSPLGKGWFGEQSDRIYRVQYRDADGNPKSAWCKTSMFTGVYFSLIDEEPSLPLPSPAQPSDADRIEALESQVRKLLKENEELRRVAKTSVPPVD